MLFFSFTILMLCWNELIIYGQFKLFCRVVELDCQYDLSEFNSRTVSPSPPCGMSACLGTNKLDVMATSFGVGYNMMHLKPPS